MKSNEMKQTGGETAYRYCISSSSSLLFSSKPLTRDNLLLLSIFAQFAASLILYSTQLDNGFEYPFGGDDVSSLLVVAVSAVSRVSLHTQDQSELICAVGFKNLDMGTQGFVYHAQDGGCDAMHVSPQCEVTKKRALVEVFAVRIIAKTYDARNRVGGVVLLKGFDKNLVLYEDPCDERGPQIDSDGYLTLIGPERGVEVEDAVVIYPWFFDKYMIFCGMTKSSILWKKDDACIPRINQFIRKGVKTTVGFMLQVDFAVYSDAVEARLEIVLCDFKFEGLLQPGKSVEVYGTIKASNGVLALPEAKSFLFSITQQNCIELSSWPPRGSEVAVPLTRNVTVIPRESALTVDVCLSLSCESQDAPIAVGSAVFDATSRLSFTGEEQIIHGQHAKAKVKVIWST